ncbi:MAG: M48 family metalloprotease [Bryobacteraceae bacterium]
MRFGSLGLFEIVLILGLVFLLFGGRHVPKAGKQLGERARRPFRKAKWIWNSMAGSEEDAIQSEEEYGSECARLFEQDTAVSAHSVKTRMVSETGEKLTAKVGKGRRFVFRVIQTPRANAFALPGGFIYVTEALLEVCGHAPDEIAFILGHEMGHVLLGHASERYMSDTLLDQVTKRLPAASGLIRSAISSGYSREQEFEADSEGQRLAVSAGFDAMAGVRVMRQLATVSPAHSGLLDEYLSTHPPLEARAAALARQG